MAVCIGKARITWTASLGFNSDMKYLSQFIHSLYILFSLYNFYVKVLLSMMFVFSYFNLVFAKPLHEETQSRQYSQDRDFQPFLVDATEHEGYNSKTRNHTSVDRIARNTQPCVESVVREFDDCRNQLVDKVQCKRRHPACSHVVSIHGIPKCQPVYGFRNATFVTKCPSLPIDCQCAV